MRCVVCHCPIKNGDTYITADLWKLKRSGVDREILDMWESVVCNKDHLMEYISKTVEKGME